MIYKNFKILTDRQINTQSYRMLDGKINRKIDRQTSCKRADRHKGE